MKVRRLNLDVLVKIHCRVVSAYENKILRPEIRLGAWFLNNYGEPTFPKFVDVIIEGAKDCDTGVCQNLDEHWKPFNAGCTYCDLKYDYITKVSQLSSPSPQPQTH